MLKDTCTAWAEMLSVSSLARCKEGQYTGARKQQKAIILHFQRPESQRRVLAGLVPSGGSEE